MANHEEMSVSLAVEKKDAAEVLAALAHTVLFHRSTGDVRPQDFTCHGFNLTYAMCGSPKLIGEVDQISNQFTKSLTANKHNTGSVSLSFHQKRRVGLFRREEKNVWERWVFEIKIIGSTGDQAAYREALVTSLTENLQAISKSILRKDSHVPAVVETHAAESVDTELMERPFLHDWDIHTGPVAPQSTWDTARRIVTNVFASGV